MKKILCFLLAVMLIWSCGCKNKADTESKPSKSSEKTASVPAGDENSLLTDAEWVGHDGRCENHITFNKDKFFGNNCACGEPVGFGDVTEIYSFNSKDKTIDLFDCDGEKLETAKVLFLDKNYLVIDIWDDVYVYANQKGYVQTVHEGALDHVNTDETFPCLAVLEYENNKFTVSSHNYDGDTPDLFERFELEAAEGVTFKSVSVTDDNGVVIVDDITLSESEYQYIGEYYSHGFFEFNENGQVTHITFYGEIVIQG